MSEQNYLYRVEYRHRREGAWVGADGLTFDTEGMAEAHMNWLTGHVYDENYRIVRRPISMWEVVDS